MFPTNQPLAKYILSLLLRWGDNHSRLLRAHPKTLLFFVFFVYSSVIVVLIPTAAAI